MRRVLMISPHFPPDPSAGAHRVRLLAPHLARHGWEPTVLTVDPAGYEGQLDRELLALVPDGTEVVRCRAASPVWTRSIGVGDLGLRALPALWTAANALLARNRYDAVFITIYPTYPAVLGPLLKRRFGVPFVLDYQDPWVGEWGRSVGGAANGGADLKSRLTRRVACLLEPRVVAAADGVTAVSTETYAAVLRRTPNARPAATADLPIGWDLADREYLLRRPRPNHLFDSSDGRLHVSYAGTLLPLGRDVLRAVLQGVAQLRRIDPALYERLVLHFIGTSNQTTANAAMRVVPDAEAAGVADRVHEVPGRVPYLDALNALMQSAAVLLMGSSEPHYTASKLYAALLSERPLIAVFHEASDVTRLLRQGLRQGDGAVITYDERRGPGERVGDITDAFRRLGADGRRDGASVEKAVMASHAAAAVAARLAGVLDRVAEVRAA